MVAKPIAIPTAEPRGANGESMDALARTPWYLWAGGLAVASAAIGMEWDVSWHRSIGRDTFWTPAHMLIYFCGVLTAAVCSYLILGTTFGRQAGMRTKSVRIFGFCAPIGCFLATWGGLAMLVSAFFDDWWHSAYGLDVQVFSPPHLLLLTGLDMVAIGFLLLTAGALNRASAASRRAPATLRYLFLMLGGSLIYLQIFIISQRVDRGVLHSAPPYKNLAVAVLPWFAILSQVARTRWALTWAAGVYTGIRIGAILLLPLFPAAPKLGPVFTPVTHFVPEQFPVLVMVPALALDLLWQAMNRSSLGRRAIAGGVVFLGTLVATEWPFASFLMSKAAQNRFFGVLYAGFGTLPQDRLPHLTFVQTGSKLALGLLVATLYAVAASWLGLMVGRWMRSVQR